MERIVIVNNYIQEYASAIMVWGNGAGTYEVRELVIIGNVIARVNKATMDGFDLDKDGTGVAKQVTCIGNEPRNLTNVWVTHPAVPTLIGGNRLGAGALYSCTNTPEGAITENIGAMALRRNGGAGTTLYIKESGTGNTGWTAK